MTRHRNMSGYFFHSHQKDVFSQESTSNSYRMKKINFASILLIFLSSCGNKVTDTISLEGEIKGLGNDTVYIYGTDNLYNHIDTLIASNDKISATLSTDTLVATNLLFKNGEEYPLFLNKGNKIQIKGSMSQLSSLEIKGNVHNEELGQYQKALKGLGKPSDKVLEEKAEAFIKSHNSSPASIYLLKEVFLQKPQPNFQKIKELINHMTGELKDRPYIVSLLKQIKEEEKVFPGKSAPYFRITNAKGKSINRYDFRNKYLLICFWASWDQQSRKTNAFLQQIYKEEKKNKKFSILSISLDINQERWKEAIQKDSLEWEQACDFNGWNTEIVNQFAIQTIPSNILLNPSGKIEGKNLSEEDIKNKLTEIKQEEK